MLSVQDLEFRYGPTGFRLRVPRLTVERGGKAALVGPSGTGKTTLLNLLAGIAVPSSGRIMSADVEVSALSEKARREFRVRQIGLIFQEFELLEHLTVLDNVLLTYRLSPALKLDRAVRERAEGLLRDVGLGDKLRRFPRKLSQGERQRVAVCRALLSEPPLLLCDEPTGNLDAANRAHVLDILAEYAKRSSATMLTVTHDGEILERFDTVIDIESFHGEGEVHA
jgi:ABC-type lipoprotein export system ATPase subunit